MIWKTKLAEITAEKQKYGGVAGMKRNEDSLRDLWDNIKHMNIWITWVPEGEERERTWENIWRDNSWKLLLHGKENSQFSLEVQRVPVRINPRRNTWSHIVIKLAKIKGKDKILKATREKWQIVQGNSHQVISWFLNRNSTNQKRMTWYI